MSDATANKEGLPLIILYLIIRHADLIIIRPYDKKICLIKRTHRKLYS